VDGVYAAVNFSSNDDKESDPLNLLGSCRLFRIDQLTTTSASQLPSPFQLTPKKLKLPSTSKALTMSVDYCGITAILSMSNGTLRSATISLLGGAVSEKGYFPQVQMNYFTKQNKLKLHSMVTMYNVNYSNCCYGNISFYSHQVSGCWKMKMVVCFLLLKTILVALRIFLL